MIPPRLIKISRKLLSTVTPRLHQRIRNVGSALSSLGDRLYSSVPEPEELTPKGKAEAERSTMIRRHRELKKAVSGVVYLRNQLASKVEDTEKDLAEVNGLIGTILGAGLEHLVPGAEPEDPSRFLPRRSPDTSLERPDPDPANETDDINVMELINYYNKAEELGQTLASLRTELKRVSEIAKEVKSRLISDQIAMADHESEMEQADRKSALQAAEELLRETNNASNSTDAYVQSTTRPTWTK